MPNQANRTVLTVAKRCQVRRLRSKTRSRKENGRFAVPAQALGPLPGTGRTRSLAYRVELQGQVPETIVSGQTADILPFVEYEWFEWVIWYDRNAEFPNAKETLGRWLGPSLDIGPAMTAKIMKKYGQITYLSSHRCLTDLEYQDPLAFENFAGLEDAAYENFASLEDDED
jgi:hypothetical protein